MKLRLLLIAGLVTAATALAGCDQGRQPPGRTNVAFVNAAPSFRALSYLRGARATAANPVNPLAFKGTNAAQYDEDTYNFQVAETALSSSSSDRIWRFTQTVKTGTNYVVVLTDDANQVEPVIVEYPTPATGATNVQITGVNAAATRPAIDLYLTPAGAGIAGAAPLGSLAFQQQLTAQTVSPGDYEITLTEGGNAANVLLTSNSFTLAAAQPTTIVIVDEGGLGTQSFSVLLVSGARLVLYDRNATAELRVLNAAADRQPRDFAIGGQFSPPLFSAMPFGEPTPYAQIPIADVQDINVTPVGNPGVLELDQELAAVARGARYTLMFTGDAGTLLHVVTDDDGRRLPNEAKLRIFDGASQFLQPTLLVLPPGGVAGTTAPVANATLAANTLSTYLSIAAGEYDLVLYQFAIPGTTTTDALLAGPVRVTLANGGIYGVLAVNGATTAAADLFLIDDFP